MILIPLFLYSWCVQAATEIDAGKRKHTHPLFSLERTLSFLLYILKSYNSPTEAQHARISSFVSKARENMGLCPFCFPQHFSDTPA